MTARRLGRILVWIVVGILIGACATWTGGVLLTPKKVAGAGAKYTLVSTREGEVFDSIKLNVSAMWPRRYAVTNRASGVVTAIVVRPRSRVFTGDVLIRVDESPVVAATGSVPAYRDIRRGDHGRDVTQLQQLLRVTGFFDGPINGKFGSATEHAVKLWQKHLDITANGEVKAGSVIFFPKLPVSVSSSKLLQIGAELVGGEKIFAVLAPVPKFVVSATNSQAALMPPGTRVRIEAPGGKHWAGEAGKQTVDDQNGTTNVQLGPAHGEQSICGASCADLKVKGTSLLKSEIVTVPLTKGITVPTAAITVDADGLGGVTDKHGRRHVVTVVEAADGIAVVKGIGAGLQVRVIAGSGS